MKKIKLLRALALASCVMLSGCDLNKKEEEKTPETPQVDPAISVAELPASVNLGQGLNMDQYVTLTALSSFELELATASAGKASIDGHVITPLVEGEISFSVKSGSISKACIINAVSQNRSKIKEYFKDVGREYVVVEYQQDTTSGEWGQSGLIMHTKQYVADLSEGVGFLRYSIEDTDTFYFELAYDPVTYEYTGVDEDSLQFMASSYFDLYYNPEELSLDFDELVAEYDEVNECEYLLATGTDATFFAEEALFIPNGELSLSDDEDAEGYPIERVEFVFEEGVDEDEHPYSVVTAYPYIQYEGKWSLFAACEIYVREEAFSFPLLDEYCVPENKPEGIDYWEYFDDGNIGQLFASPESLLGDSGRISLTYGWFDAAFQPIAVPASTSETLFKYLYPGNLEKVWNETSVWAVEYEYDDETGDVTSVAPKSGKVQVTKDEVTKVYDVYATGVEETPFYAEADSACATVWDDSVQTLGGLRNHESWAPGSILSVTEPSEKAPYYSFAFAPGKTHDILSSIISFDEEGYIYNLGYVIAQYAAAGLDVESMFNGGMFYDAVNKNVTIQYMFVWDASSRYVVNLEFQGDDSVGELVAGFEAAAAPYLEPAPSLGE